jgi:hypothetical protein
MVLRPQGLLSARRTRSLAAEDEAAPEAIDAEAETATLRPEIA